MSTDSSKQNCPDCAGSFEPTTPEASFGRAVRLALQVWGFVAIGSGIVGFFAGFYITPHSGGFDPLSAGAFFVWMLAASLSVAPIAGVVTFVVASYRNPIDLPFPRVKLARRDRGRQRVEEARQVAALHLHNPVYIADYARIESISLDEVHTRIAEGKLTAYRHEGILFVEEG